MKWKNFIIILLFVFLFKNTAFSLDKTTTGNALEGFTKKQYELIFESDLGKIQGEYPNISSVSKKIDVFGRLETKTKFGRLKTQIQLNQVLSKIGSLKDAIGIIEEDIGEALLGIKSLSINIQTAENKIKENTKRIEILNKKIEKNRSILLEYLEYLYKKQNTAYSKGKIDNIKSILLNNGDISDLLNDLYFNSLVQVAGKKLIENHKVYISELYMKKVSLQKEKRELSVMRRDLIVEQVQLKEKRKFKQILLDTSKGKQEEYKKFLNAQLKMEKKLKNIAYKEKLKLGAIKQKILGRHNCQYVDLSSNSLEAKRLEKQGGKCYSINKMIDAEAKLTKDSKLKKTKVGNFLSWPVSPYRGITSFFKDEEYKKEFGADHNAIDVRLTQGTSIKAPIDGYVIYVKPPTDQSYSFVALKHTDGYITVYGHLSEVFVKEYDFVKKGEIFSKSGGSFGTLGAGYITTGSHLHFELFKDKAYVDPLKYLDLSYLDYNNLPLKYKLKYVFDFKKRKGYGYDEVNKNTRIFTLKGKNEIERQKHFLSKYASSAFNDWQMWVDVGVDGNIDPSLLMCIGLAESGLGTNLTTGYNIGNVGNNDRGDRVAFSSARQGIKQITNTLNNRYLGNIDRLDALSGAGRKISKLPACKVKGEYCYATDTNHWHRNVTKCLSHMKGYLIPDNYYFRNMK